MSFDKEAFEDQVIADMRDQGGAISSAVERNKDGEPPVAQADHFRDLSKSMAGVGD